MESTRLLGNCCVAPYESTRSEEVDDRAQEIESYKIREEVALRLQFSQVIPRLKIPVMHKVTLAFLYNLCADDGNHQPVRQSNIADCRVSRQASSKRRATGTASLDHRAID